MKNEEWYALGQKARYLLTGFTGSPASPGGTEPEQTTEGSTSYGNGYSGRSGGYGGELPAADALTGACNQAAHLKPGHLLVTYQVNNYCYQVDPVTGDIEFLFYLRQARSPFIWRAIADRDGRIYCTISGSKYTVGPLAYAEFGTRGAIVRIQHRQDEIETIASGKGIVDPCGIEFLGESLLLICDFQNFGGSGAVYTVDRSTGDVNVRASGGLLQDPCSAVVDEQGVLWVANARGDSDGDLIRVEPNGDQKVVMPARGQGSGGVVGVCMSNDPEQLIVTKLDWPMMATSAVMLVNKNTGQVQNLLSASSQEPRFYSSNVAVSGDMMWVGEAVEKRIIGYDLKQRREVKSIDFRGIMGGHRGMVHSYSSIENISIVPDNLIAGG